MGRNFAQERNEFIEKENLAIQLWKKIKKSNIENLTVIIRMNITASIIHVFS
jgi:hypothetical protein